jgi:hypothetical protein
LKYVVAPSGAAVHTMCGIDSAILSVSCRSQTAPSDRTVPASGPAVAGSEEVVTNEPSVGTPGVLAGPLVPLQPGPSSLPSGTDS